MAYKQPYGMKPPFTEKTRRVVVKKKHGEIDPEFKEKYGVKETKRKVVTKIPASEMYSTGKVFKEGTEKSFGKNSPSAGAYREGKMKAAKDLTIAGMGTVIGTHILQNRKHN